MNEFNHVGCDSQQLPLINKNISFRNILLFELLFMNEFVRIAWELNHIHTHWIFMNENVIFM
jgi:hypothetical protein